MIIDQTMTLHLFFNSAYMCAVSMHAHILEPLLDCFEINLYKDTNVKTMDDARTYRKL